MGFDQPFCIRLNSGPGILGQSVNKGEETQHCFSKVASPNIWKVGISCFKDIIMLLVLIWFQTKRKNTKNNFEGMKYNGGFLPSSCLSEFFGL